MSKKGRYLLSLAVGILVGINVLLILVGDFSFNGNILKTKESERLEKFEYMGIVMDALKPMEGYADDVFYLSSNKDVSAGIYTRKEATQKLEYVVSEVHIALDKIESIRPPVELDGFHELLLRSNEEMRLYSDMALEGYKNEDALKVLESNKHYAKCHEYLTEAISMVDSLE